MEYRIKKARGECDYTGAESDICIKLYDVAGGETGWMSIEMLTEAAQILGAVSGRSVATPNPVLAASRMDMTGLMPSSSLPLPGEEIAKPVPKVSSEKDSVNLEAFREACVELGENPPPNAKGETDGVAEIHIRGLVQRWKARFRDPRLLYPVLQQIFALPRERFDLMI